MEGNSKDKRSSLETSTKQTKISRAGNGAQVSDMAAVHGVQSSLPMNDVTLQAALSGNQTNYKATDQLKNLPSLHGQHTEQNKIHQPSLQHLQQHQDYFLPGMIWDQSLQREACFQYPTYQRFANTARMEDPLTDQLSSMVASHTFQNPPPCKIQKTGHFVTPEMSFERARQQQQQHQQQHYQEQQKSQSSWQTRSTSCPPSIVNPPLWQGQMSQQQQLIYQLRHPPKANQFYRTQSAALMHPEQQFTFSQPQGYEALSIGRTQATTTQSAVILPFSRETDPSLPVSCIATQMQPFSAVLYQGVGFQNCPGEMQQQQLFSVSSQWPIHPQSQYPSQHELVMSSDNVQINPVRQMQQTFPPQSLLMSNINRQRQRLSAASQLSQVEQQPQQSHQDTATELMTRHNSVTETEENHGSPPQLSIEVPRISDLPKTSKPWSDAELPVDILLLTVDDCEFLSCFYFLEKPFKSYCIDIGPVYFGSVGSGDQEKLKIALIKCSKGSAGPSGSSVVLKNSVRILRPKAVFSVGTCIGLNSEVVKLGDVVVSSKLTTFEFKTPVSRDIGNLITNAADGWKAPLKNSDVPEPRVHCDGDVLSQPLAACLGWRYEDIRQLHPEAIAVEREGEGVFAAAHDDKLEWVIVKGVARYGDHSQCSDVEWESFASTMAASVVANILSDPVIFQEWSHCNQGASVQSFDVETCRSKLARHYKKTAKIPTSVWASVGQVELDKLYTRLSWVKKEQTPTGPSEDKLRHYTNLFTAEKDENIPKRVLVQGETGIGKSTFVKKLAVDWAELDDAEMTEEQKDALRKFKLVLVVTLKDVSSCQTLEEVIRRSHLFPEDAETSTDDLLSYIRVNQEKVLLVFDGYDEYRTGIEAETHFGSRSDSPIYKIFQGNILRDCTVLVTARISQAGELQKDADKHAEVTGFDGEDKWAFMRKMLNSESNVYELLGFLIKNKVVDLARVPLLNLFFCLLWKEAKDKLVGLTKSKTKLYQAIVRHILQYRHQKDSPRQVWEVKEENYEELLAEIGKVALEGLLKGNQVFEYGQLSEKVRGEESLIVGLFQLSEHGACLEPTEVVSFIHKSIQEFLAAWYITYRCVPEESLGGAEGHACTLKGCGELENVFQFVCGLSEQGAVKTFNHLATIRISDPSVDLSDFIPDEEKGTNWSRETITREQLQFNNLVVNSFQECSSKAEVARHLHHITGGVVLLRCNDPSVISSLLKVLCQGELSWTFLFDPFFWVRYNNFYDMIGKFLDFLYVPVNFTESSMAIRLGEFLTNFMRECFCCNFSSMLCYRDGWIQFFITDLELHCDAYVRVLTEAADEISNPFLSAKLSSNQPCLKFLSSLEIQDPNGKSLKDLGRLIGNCKHLKWIRIYRPNWSDHSKFPYCVCDLLGQVKNPAFCTLEIGYLEFEDEALTLTSAVAVKLAGLLPRFNSITELFLDVSECCATAVTTLVLSITHKTLRNLGLIGIRLSPAVAASLGQVLPEMSSLKSILLTGVDGSILKAEEMKWLFGGLSKPLPLNKLYFSRFSVRGSLFPLTEILRFFPELSHLYLSNLDLDEHDLCDLLKSFTFLPKLENLSLYGNPLGHAVTSIAPHLTNLPELKYLCLDETDGSNEDKSYVLKAVERVRPMLEDSLE